ncbi:MAG TPA: DUF2298 domain-containing protein [Chloroflexia bacterium]|nr:DUF2298 domain-containing protein [Chloroflexia bacterium]
MTAFLTKNRQQVIVWGTLALILLVGAAFRFQALKWDQGQAFHPDERAIIIYTQPLNTIPTTGAANSPRKAVGFPYGGLGFFIPNDKTNLRPATQEETDAYYKAKGQGQSFSLPSNVVAPDQPVPAGAINFWNANFSPLNSHFFAYGDFPKYLIKFGGFVMGAVTGQNWDDFDHLILVGRFLSGIWSMGTLLLTFLLARLLFTPAMGRLRGDTIGLIAAAFLAVSVLDIQLAHFAAFDVTLTFFITLSLYMAVRMMRSGRLLTAIGMGTAIGLALSVKISAAPVVLSAILAALLYGLYGSAKESGERAGRPNMLALPGSETTRYGENNVALGPRLLKGTLLNLVVAGLVALVVWFVAMPYAFIDFANFSSRIIEEAGMSRGVDSFPYTRQYVGTIPYLYQIGNLLQWGVGIPLGVLALAGLAFSLWQAVRLRLKVEWILLSFVILYSLVTFSAEAKFNRYMLPVLPVLLILGARLVVSVATARPAARHASELEEISGEEGELVQSQPVVVENRPLFRYRLRTGVMTAIALLAFGWAAVWALSFSQIYSHEHTMNQATLWMDKNIPQGKSISTEVWDEGLPTRLNGDSAAQHGWCDPDVLSQSGYCQPVQMDMYPDRTNEDNIEYFVNQLRKTDYITIASNRLYATMPKLPWRYPIQIRFYELLFSGKLGYTNVGTFTDYPTIPLLNIPINDDSADESFTVYDHPKVFIFQKTNPLTDDEIRGLFSEAAKAPAIPTRHPSANELPVRKAGQGDGVLDSATAGQVRQNGKTLLLDKPVDRLPVIDDMGWNQLANDNQWLAFLLWVVLMQVLGLVALPIAWRVCRRLPDRGYILAKPIGAVIIALVIWLLVWTRLFMNTAWTAWLALGLTALFSAWLWWHNREELNGWLRAHRRLILIEEAVFLGVLVAWTLFRLGNPDLWHPYFGGEKPMEMTHLQGIMRSAYFPPYDPWFEDGYINYYFYGQYLVSTWLKLTGINPYIGFNLIIPAMYAFTCTAAFSLVFNLTTRYKRHRSSLDQTINTASLRGPVITGLFGVVIFAFIGNMDGLLQLLQRLKPMVNLANAIHLYPDQIEPLKKFDYFRSSRVIPGTINEFPAFSFIYSDLHAHLIALSFTLVTMSLAFNLLSTNWSRHVELTPDGRRDFFQMTIGRIWQIFDRTLVTPILMMILIGFLGATNSWDLPTYLLLLGCGFFLALFRRYFSTPAKTVTVQASLNENDEAEAPAEEQFEEKTIEEHPRFNLPSLAVDVVLTGLILVITLVGGIALYWNFFGNFQSFYTEIGILPDNLPTYSYQDVTTISGRTEFKYFLVIFLLPLFLITTYFVWNFYDWWRSGPSTPQPDYDEGDYEEYEEEEWDEYPEEEQRPVSQQQTIRSDGLNFLKRRWNLPLLKIRRPELALSVAGADGGSGNGFGSGGNNFTSAPSPRNYNRYARTWIVGFSAFAIFCLVTGIVAPNNWLVFLLSLVYIVGCLVLTVGRSFDRRHTEQSAEGHEESGMFLRLMLMAAFGVTAATEVIYLRDDMGGEYTRMNTIFKLQYQVWALLALAAAAGTYVLWIRWIMPGWNAWMEGRRRKTGIVRRFVWIGILGLLVFFGLLYPIQAIPARVTERSSDPIPAPTLDGRAYFKNMLPAGGVPNMPGGLAFDLKFDAQSLFEFYDKIKGTPVVLEASIWPYRGGGSWIPINTGLPTVVGWDHHERQQRWPEMVSNRTDCGGYQGDVRKIYNTPSIQEALDLLKHYHVTYIHVGAIERDAQVEAGCPNPGNYEPWMSEEGFAKFQQMAQLGLLKVAYQNPGVVVYELTGKGESGVISGDLSSVGAITVSDPKEARLQASVKANPDSAQAHYNLGTYYYSKKQYDKAAAELETVVKLQPNRVNPYHVLGDIYRDSGDSTKALAMYKKATEIPAPPEEMPAAFNKYGIALQEGSFFDEALKQFDEATKRDKYFNEAYYHKGEIYEAQGNKAAAIQAYQQTIANSQKKDDFWTQRANQKIRELASK